MLQLSDLGVPMCQKELIFKQNPIAWFTLIPKCTKFLKHLHSFCTFIHFRIIRVKAPPRAFIDYAGALWAPLRGTLRVPQI